VNYEDTWTKVTLASSVSDVDDLRHVINREFKLDTIPTRIIFKTHDGKVLDQEDAPVPEGFTSKATALTFSLKPEKKSKEPVDEPKKSKEKDTKEDKKTRKR